MTKYRLEVVKNNFSEWDKILSDSQQCNIYFSPILLNNLGRRVKFFLVYKVNEVVAGIALLESEENNKIEFDEIVIYNGIFFSSRDGKRLTGIRAEQFEITEFIINELNNIYSSICLRLHPSFSDIRPFLWHNYGNNSKKFLTEVRYTTYLDITDINSNPEKILTNMSQIRRQHIRYGKESKLSIKESKKVEVFIGLYSKIFDKTSNKIDNKIKERLSHLINTLIGNKLAVMYECLDEDNNIKYIALFSIFKGKSIYLYGAPSENQSPFDGTFLLWESFKLLNSRHNIYEVDLEGVNSPQRGKYKLSFGGNLTSYYELVI